MKKLLVALILAVVLTLTLATPAFAGPPEDKPGNMPGKSEGGLTNAYWSLVYGSWGIGWGYWSSYPHSQGRFYGSAVYGFQRIKMLISILP